MDGEAGERLRNAAAFLTLAAEGLLERSAELVALAEDLASDVGLAWAFPVGTEEYPLEAWYAATVHDPSGRANNGYGHTGIDLNVDRWPWGDIDRGQPVRAVADGIIQEVDYSHRYLGSVILEVEHEGGLLYWRYWHLMRDDLFRSLEPLAAVRAGDPLGHIGNYTLGAGGDHLHLDCATQLFGPHWWFTNHPQIEWIDPVPVLMAHLDDTTVGRMLAKGVG